MNKVMTKLGLLLAFVLLASSMQANAARVAFRSTGWIYPSYLYIKAPGENQYVESHDHWFQDGKGSNENLKKGTMICAAVDTQVLDPTTLKSIYKKSYFEIPSDTEGTTFLDLHWPDFRPVDAYYGFGGKTIDQDYNGAGLVENKELSKVSTGLCNPPR